MSLLTHFNSTGIVTDAIDGMEDEFLGDDDDIPEGFRACGGDYPNCKFSVLEHKQDEKKIRDFDCEDWKEIGIDAAKGVGKGAARGAIVYVATNVTHIPATAVSAAVTGGVVIVENTVKYAKGESDSKECLEKIADGCMLTAVSAASAQIGKKLIPIPVVGPILGSAIGTGLYKLAKKPVMKLYKFFFDSEPCVA